MSKPREHKDLKDKHLMHFNRVSKNHPEKPVWWCVARALKLWGAMNGEGGMSGKVA